MNKKLITLTFILTLVISLSGCGGSNYAVKGCKPTENFPCVPADENNIKETVILKNANDYVDLGLGIKTGSKIIVTPNKGKKNPNCNLTFSLTDPAKTFTYKDISVIVDGEETDKVELSWDQDTTIELPDEAIGKYVHVYLNSEDGQQQDVGEFTITVE